METSASCEARYAPLLYPTNQSYRPRASDRTMVGILAATQLLVASETEGVVTTAT